MLPTEVRISNPNLKFSNIQRISNLEKKILGIRISNPNPQIHKNRILRFEDESWDSLITILIANLILFKPQIDSTFYITNTKYRDSHVILYLQVTGSKNVKFKILVGYLELEVYVCILNFIINSIT